jgi:hypothetical protein
MHQGDKWQFMELLIGTAEPWRLNGGMDGREDRRVTSASVWKGDDIEMAVNKIKRLVREKCAFQQECHGRFYQPV